MTDSICGTGMFRLLPVSWTLSCFFMSGGGFVKKFSFSKSSSQPWRGLGQAFRRCGPLQRVHFPASWPDTEDHKWLIGQIEVYAMRPSTQADL